MAGDSTTICIPLTSAPELLSRCLRTVLSHTPADIAIVVAGEDPADPRVEGLIDDLAGRVRYVGAPRSDGPVAAINQALAVALRTDVVLLASHAIVPEGWLERIAAAGRSDTTVATASALGNEAGIVSVGGSPEPLSPDFDPERLAAAVAERSRRAFPRIPTAAGHCVWISKAALDLVGPLDAGLRSPRAAVVDLSQRCVLQGLLNVAADDLFVASAHPPTAVTGAGLDLGEDGGVLRRRYPYLPQALATDMSPVLVDAVSTARRALQGASVTIDARILRGASSGAHAETLELIETLARTGQVKVRALVDPAIGRDAVTVLDRLPEVERLDARDAGPDIERSDIVHRPYQVTSPADLELLPRLGERIVITHLDLIAFHNPGYFGSFVEWQQYRRVTRQALAMADRAIFLSEHARRDAIKEGLVEDDRSHVVPMAVRGERPPVTPRRPSEAPPEPFLLSIGNDFRHKNRVFAIQLLGELRARGWDGHLALAGADVGAGSSRADEAEYLASRRDLAPAVHDLGAVGEDEKEWLYANAAAVVYPSVYEGFGLIPFEAARAGTPCLFAPQASLAEVLPADAAVLVPWNAPLSAERALPLLTDADERRRHVDLVTAAASRASDWDTLGRELLGIYEEAARLPYREAARLAVDASMREAQLSQWLALGIETDRLIGEDAHLPRDVQRALLALSTRKRLRRPLFALLRALYATGYRARRF